MDTSSSSFDDVKPKMINGKIVWSGGPSCKQRFSLPYSVMYYMAKNPSTPEVYKKLIQCCKYFFEINPILVAANMHGKTKLCLNVACDGESYDDNDDEEYAENDCCTDIDMNKLSSKICLTNTLKLTEKNISMFTSLIYPKLYQYKAINLKLYYDIILFNDFKSCAPFLTDIYLQGVVIKNNEKIVMLDNILEMVPNVKNFHLNFDGNFSMFDSFTMKNICKLNSFQNLESFILGNLREVLNVEDISTFVKGLPDKKIIFYFTGDELSEEFKIQLDDMIDTVINTHKFVIDYPGQNKEKYKIMKQHYFK
uniref:Uncharacterized protein n=1 Tax=Panagrolaimus sp. ES5 TaxID=591445 RepID=A0AC34FF13_9BILA